MAIHPGYALTELPDYCFAECSSLQEVYIPANLRSIGVNALSQCSSLKTVCFEETNGWTDSSGTPLKVDDPAENAVNLKNFNDPYIRISDD
jgi:hypothetical protein